MKKLLLSLFSASFALLSFAQTNPISVEWGKLIDGKTSAGDQATDITVDAAGNVYWFATTGTSLAAPEVFYDGEEIFEGSLYDAGASQDNNYTLIKTDAAGNKIWVVYSNQGDLYNNQGGCVATSDGGVITTAKVRRGASAMDKPFTLIDATGSETEIEWTDPEAKRAYELLVVKVSSDGQIEWTRLITFSSTPGESATGNYKTGLTECFNLGNLDIDSNDNIYIPLNIRSSVSIVRPDKTIETIEPRNVTTWTGDPQTACGDFLLLSLDNQGYYRNALTLDGTATVGYGQRVTVSDNRVFAQGYITGDGTSLTVDGLTLSPSKIMSPLLIATDIDFNVKWAKCFPAEQVQSKNAFQNVGITAVGPTLWVCGMFNLKFSDPDDATKVMASTQGSLREGFILKLDAETGGWLASRGSRDDDWNKPSATAKTGLTGYYKVLQNEQHPEDIYVYGYVMNAQVGVFMRKYDATSLVADLDNGQNNIITAGGVPSCQNIYYDAPDGVAYVTARGNNSFTMLDGGTTAKPEKWAVLAAKVKLPESMKTTGIENITFDRTDAADTEYYDLQGIRVATPSAGHIYIRRCGDKVDKVVM